MSAFILKKYCKEEKLYLTEVEEPTIKDNEVLIEIHATGINQLNKKIKKR